MIGNATFPYKTALSKTNVKANRIGSTKLILQKERSFSIHSFIFFENLIELQEPLINTRFNVPTTQMSIFILFVNA